MYEEDRQEALELYNRMFEEAVNETALYQLLMSPTRQAVIIARAYDSKARKLQVQSQSRGDEERIGTPAFLTAIDSVRNDAIELGIIVPTVSEDQFTLFDETAADRERSMNEALENFAEETPVEEAPVVEEVPVEEAPAETISFFDPPAEEEAAEEEAPVEEAAAEEPEAPAAEDAPAEEPVEELPAPPAAEPVSEEEMVDRFLADYHPEIPGSSAPAAEAPVEEVPEEETEEYTEENDFFTGSRRKVRVPLLILWILLSIVVIPLGFAPVVLLAAAFLAVASAALGGGALAVTAILGGFSVFADTLLVAGVALVLLAFGLLFLWGFIRLFVAAIRHIVGVIRLGKKVCVKEVPAE